MKTWQELIPYSTFRFFDLTNEAKFYGQKNNALTSFAIDDALTLSVSERLSPPVIRLWAHDKTVVLGIPDSHLPHIEAGVNYLVQQGYHVIIRNSGGLAVALDDGVLNVSLILPDVKQLSIHDGYDAMLHFIQHMFRDLTDDIQAYEIVGSYCPGDYDLSINGVKFAGISQRRIKDGAAIQIYLDVNGNSEERAQLIRTFYDLSKQGEETKFSYPTVNPAVMGSLSSLLQVNLTVEDVKKRVKQTIDQFNEKRIMTPFSHTEITKFETRYKQMTKRNEKIAEWL